MFISFERICFLDKMFRAASLAACLTMICGALLLVQLYYGNGLETSRKAELTSFASLRQNIEAERMEKHNITTGGFQQAEKASEEVQLYEGDSMGNNLKGNDSKKDDLKGDDLKGDDLKKQDLKGDDLQGGDSKNGDLTGDDSKEKDLKEDDSKNI